MEKRAHVRHAVSIGGELIWNGGAHRHPCLISDLSLDGARVDTGHFVDVPDRLFLLEENDGVLFECEVRWHQGGQMGLFFVDIGSRAARRSLIQRHAGNA